MNAAIYTCKSIATITILGLLFFSPVGTASDKNGNYTRAIKHGDASCGSFVSAQDESRRGVFIRLNFYNNWLAGYITAYNAVTPNTTNIMGATDMDSIMLWLENWCRQNPLKEFDDAAYALTIELYPKRKR